MPACLVRSSQNPCRAVRQSQTVFATQGTAGTQIWVLRARLAGLENTKKTMAIVLAQRVLQIPNLRRLAVRTQAAASAARDTRCPAMEHVQSALRGLTNLRRAWTPARIVNLIVGHQKGARLRAIVCA